MPTTVEMEPRCECCGQVDTDLLGQAFQHGKKTITVPHMPLRSLALCDSCRLAEVQMLSAFRIAKANLDATRPPADPESSGEALEGRPA